MSWTTLLGWTILIFGIGFVYGAMYIRGKDGKSN